MDCLLVFLRNYGLGGPAHHLKTNDALSLRFEDIKSARKCKKTTQTYDTFYRLVLQTLHTVSNPRKVTNFCFGALVVRPCLWS